MRAVNDIYDKTDFNGIKLINFKIKTLRVSLVPKQTAAEFSVISQVQKQTKPQRTTVAEPLTQACLIPNMLDCYDAQK